MCIQILGRYRCSHVTEDPGCHWFCCPSGSIARQSSICMKQLTYNSDTICTNCRLERVRQTQVQLLHYQERYDAAYVRVEQHPGGGLGPVQELQLLEREWIDVRRSAEVELQRLEREGSADLVKKNWLMRQMRRMEGEDPWGQGHHVGPISPHMTPGWGARSQWGIAGVASLMRARAQGAPGGQAHVSPQAGPMAAPMTPSIPLANSQTNAVVDEMPSYAPPTYAPTPRPTLSMETAALAGSLGQPLAEDREFANRIQATSSQPVTSATQHGVGLFSDAPTGVAQWSANYTQPAPANETIEAQTFEVPGRTSQMPFQNALINPVDGFPSLEYIPASLYGQLDQQFTFQPGLSLPQDVQQSVDQGVANPNDHAQTDDAANDGMNCHGDFEQENGNEDTEDKGADAMQVEYNKIAHEASLITTTMAGHGQSSLSRRMTIGGVYRPSASGPQASVPASDTRTQEGVSYATGPDELDEAQERRCEAAAHLSRSRQTLRHENASIRTIPDPWPLRADDNRQGRSSAPRIRPGLHLPMPKRREVKTAGELRANLAEMKRVHVTLEMSASRDQQYIRRLEEEVQWLREQLTQERVRHARQPQATPYSRSPLGHHTWDPSGECGAEEADEDDVDSGAKDREKSLERALAEDTRTGADAEDAEACHIHLPASLVDISRNF
ncbi:MAG: hypothetical protein M1838_004469 [Thelocarpon superellum]|nr:MAG: hypothetical protein M1838_004469 [Thelocarpon superellum]